MKLSDIVRRVDELLEQGEGVMQSQSTETIHLGTGQRPSVIHHVRAPLMVGFRSACLSFIERVYGKDHSHYSVFTFNIRHDELREDAERAIAIMQTIRAEIAGGWLFSVKGLISAEIFSSFLEMADHLLAESYKDAAAVMGGSVLEEHLRQLCKSNGIAIAEDRHGKSVALKAERLNTELCKTNVYNMQEQQQVTAWLNLRNQAAHGHYTEYKIDQVKHFLQGLNSFMVRVPA